MKQIYLDNVNFLRRESLIKEITFLKKVKSKTIYLNISKDFQKIFKQKI